MWATTEMSMTTRVYDQRLGFWVLALWRKLTNRVGASLNATSYLKSWSQRPRALSGAGLDRGLRGISRAPPAVMLVTSLAADASSFFIRYPQSSEQGPDTR